MAERHQIELPMFERPAEDPNVRWLEAWLERHGGWARAEELVAAAGREGDGERWVRELASASEWVISGQRGYRHVTRATAEEIRHFVNQIRSRARKLEGRAQRVLRNAHAILG